MCAKRGGPSQLAIAKQGRGCRDAFLDSDREATAVGPYTQLAEKQIVLDVAQSIGGHHLVTSSQGIFFATGSCL